MAKIIVTGVRHMDFKSRDGDQITGSKLYFLSKNPEVKGFITTEKFLSAAVMQNLGLSKDNLDDLVMSECEVDVDLNGHFVGISMISGVQLVPTT